MRHLRKQAGPVLCGGARQGAGCRVPEKVPGGHVAGLPVRRGVRPGDTQLLVVEVVGHVQVEYIDVEHVDVEKGNVEQGDEEKMGKRGGYG